LDPITKADAFRDESVSTIFDEQKINDQIDPNEPRCNVKSSLEVTSLAQYSDSKVIWTTYKQR
jgi:hypothetical protein